MFYAIGPFSDTFQVELEQAIEQIIRAKPDETIYIYALIDRIFETNRAQMTLTHMAWPLYSGTSLQALIPFSPWLLELPQKKLLRKKTIQQLCTWCNAKPMLSFLLSQQTGTELCQHFRPFIRAETSDGKRWPLRFADTRILGPLFEILTLKQQQELMAPILGWWAPDRSGRLQQLSASPQNVQNSLTCNLTLTETQFNHLLHLTLTDTVISQLYKFDDIAKPDEMCPTEFFNRIDRSVNTALQMGLNEPTPMIRFCYLALKHGEFFYQAPEWSFEVSQMRHTAQNERTFSSTTLRFKDLS